MLRLSSLVLMIVLASMGIAITGAAPIFPNKRGEYIDNEIKTEMPKEQEEDTDREAEVGIS